MGASGWARHAKSNRINNGAYVILPVVIPAGLSPEASLDDNKNYKVVWQVLQALRAHDERFNAMINQIELNKNNPTKYKLSALPLMTRRDNTPERHQK